ncbi:hypothetical protein M422DRAFT_268964 [Sphaerobolus stellatus SS14]|uniref:Unplaced genomic scaffold SPHSTscaffold_204, whole genome shotgun sequence n=1 Tax=Sphaerobolus stellatus (strain SS14) TaxID=990650 RepID=A0A0C9U5P5_SPHS4|nr:hypothetical protein M422DRAFT_268964 [Sphaerobolus stellatus SS14]
MTDQPFVDLPRYQFLSTYFGGFVYSTPPGSLLKGLRPDMGLPGRYEMHGENISTSVYVTRPVSAVDPADKCLDLQSAIRVKLPGSGNPPKPTWALREDMVLFGSQEDHLFLQKALSLVAFNPQSRPAHGARFPDAFDPLCLETLAFTYFALANLVKEKRQEFSAYEYFLVYVDYLEMLKDFQAEEPEEFENHLMIMLADGKKNLGNMEKVIRKKKQTAGFSGNALKKELSMMMAAQPSQVPQGMALAAVLAPHDSTTAAIGNISQAMVPLPAYRVPYPAPYGYPPGAQPCHFAIPQGPSQPNLAHNPSK